MADILVVDDNNSVRSLVASALATLGHVVVGAADGYEALQRFGELRPALVITDHDMPGQSALAEMLQLARSTGVKVILISGHLASDQPPKANEWPLLVKPFSLSALFAAVRGVLGSPAQDPRTEPE